MENENLPQTTDNQIATRPGSIPIDRETVRQLADQRQILMEYVKGQLRKNVDHGIIPGCKKPSLFKPGAEKLRTLFNLTVTQELKERVLDRDNNFALYSYKATVSKNGVIIAECEGTCNSQEKKYKEKGEWNYDEKLKKNVETKVVVPCCDILNTLQKMAQKRAYVGAIILATGASDFFDQDIDDIKDAKTLGIVPEDNKKSNEPKIKTVSDQPEINHDNTFMIKAMTSYQEKDLPKAAGFRWDKDQKEWLKEVNGYEFENGFGFKVEKL